MAAQMPEPQRPQFTSAGEPSPARGGQQRQDTSLSQIIRATRQLSFDEEPEAPSAPRHTDTRDARGLSVAVPHTAPVQRPRPPQEQPRPRHHRHQQEVTKLPSRASPPPAARVESPLPALFSEQALVAALAQRLAQSQPATPPAPLPVAQEEGTWFMTALWWLLGLGGGLVALLVVIWVVWFIFLNWLLILVVAGIIGLLVLLLL